MNRLLRSRLLVLSTLVAAAAAQRVSETEPNGTSAVLIDRPGRTTSGSSERASRQLSRTCWISASSALPMAESRLARNASVGMVA